MTTSTLKRCRRSPQTAPDPDPDPDTNSAYDVPPSGGVAGTTTTTGTSAGAGAGAGARARGGAETETAATSGSASSISKRDSQEDAWASKGYNYINPFVHRIEIDSHVEMAKIYALTVLLLPIRVVGCVLSLITAWMFAYVGLYGMTLDDLKAKPLSGWRKQVQYLASRAMRMVYASGSFHSVTMKGCPASAKEAPILVVAPHSSYVDSILVVARGPPSIVAKRETADIPLLGKIINYAQPIYVQREDPNSRQNTIREIVARARSTDDWPQVVIFAEGTCTNRSALIKFKPGAFYPGVPVQPVLLKYPNKYDTFTWTWDGPGVLRLLWLTMAQFYNRCEIEYLPVYTPSPEEVADANLYAHNVREVMANALGVPTSDYSFEDVIVMSRARDMKIPFPGDIIEIERTIEQMGLLESQRDMELCERYLQIANSENLDFVTFGKLLDIDLRDPHLHKLFALFDHRRRGTVSLKSFLLCSLFCKFKNSNLISFLRALVNIYSESSQQIDRESFVRLVRHAGGKLNEQKAQELFYSMDPDNLGYVSFDNFTMITSLQESNYGFLYRKSEQIRRPKPPANAPSTSGTNAVGN